jgi:coenzyme F420-reducing hydrogenase delta subunit
LVKKTQRILEVKIGSVAKDWKWRCLRSKSLDAKGPTLVASSCNFGESNYEEGKTKSGKRITNLKRILQMGHEEISFFQIVMRSSCSLCGNVITLGGISGV